MTNHSVWKFPITSPVQLLSMPTGSRVLTVATQGGDPTVWVLVPLDNLEDEVREIHCYGTGHKITDVDDLTYLGTAHDVSGLGLVFHIFERTLAHA